MVRDERGFAIAAVLGLLVVFAVLALVAALVSSGQLSFSFFHRASKKAFLAAEAGVEEGIARIPDIDAFPADSGWLQLPDGSRYRSGNPTGAPQPIQVRALSRVLPGYGTHAVFNQYVVRASGQDPGGRAQRTVEAGVQVGPLPRGTGY